MSAFFDDFQEQRDAQIVREMLRQWPRLEPSPDFDASVFDNRVLEAIRREPWQFAPPQHLWTRRERFHWWLARHFSFINDALFGRFWALLYVAFFVVALLLIFNAFARHSAIFSSLDAPRPTESALQSQGVRETPANEETP